MFYNYWRKLAWVLWVVCIPLALVGGLLRGAVPHGVANALLAVGLLGCVAGLILLKSLGRRLR